MRLLSGAAGLDSIADTPNGFDLRVAVVHR